MPTYIQESDYDLFDYDYDSTGLSLEDAIKKARELQAKSSGSVFYRIVPTDTKGVEFRVIEVSKEEIFSGFMNRFAQWTSRFRLGRRSR